MGMVKHSQSFRNSKFAMCLQYFKKQVRDEDDFLDADKHQSLLQDDFKARFQGFLQGNTIIIDAHDQAFLQYSKEQVCNIFIISQKRS